VETAPISRATLKPLAGEEVTRDLDEHEWRYSFATPRHLGAVADRFQAMQVEGSEECVADLKWRRDGLEAALRAAAPQASNTTSRIAATMLQARAALACNMERGASEHVSTQLGRVMINVTHDEIAKMTIPHISQVNGAELVKVPGDSLCTIRVLGLLHLISTKEIENVDSLTAAVPDNSRLAKAALAAVELATTRGNAFGLETDSLRKCISALGEGSQVSTSSYGDALSVAMNAGVLCVSVDVSTEQATSGNAQCQILMPNLSSDEMRPNVGVIHTAKNGSPGHTALIVGPLHLEPAPHVDKRRRQTAGALAYTYPDPCSNPSLKPRNQPALASTPKPQRHPWPFTPETQPQR